ncbi:hypothetical protein Taro_011253 [Colocasia esculenta]|uniref:Uncharacterized protein n=1 Tax=Colocasia esculenta TaxID=4460 RepID=A0A843UC40_COLES|nr:hypothetical protein [Colocasia esculenta]
MDDDDGILESERLQIQLIRELDMEELQVEEVDDNDDLSTDEDDNDSSGHADAEAGSYGSFTFDTSLASLHTYLGEIDDTHGRMMTLDGGVTLTLPVFYLEGSELIPSKSKFECFSRILAVDR